MQYLDTERFQGHAGRMVILLAVAEDQEISMDKAREGTPGVLLTGNDPQELLDAMRALGRGRALRAGHTMRRVMLHVSEPDLEPVPGKPGFPLSPREKEVLHALVEGLSYKMIAHRLSISFETVRTHIKRIYEKLQVHNNAEAVAKALRSGLVGLG